MKCFLPKINRKSKRMHSDNSELSRIKQYRMSKSIAVNAVLEDLEHRQSQIKEYTLKDHPQVLKQPEQLKEYDLSPQYRHYSQDDHHTKVNYSSTLQTKPRSHISSLLNQQSGSIDPTLLVKQLRDTNSLFRKLTPELGIALINIGHIWTFLPEQIIHRENDSVQYLCIVLRGQVLLRNRAGTTKHHCFSGDFLNEELLLDDLDYAQNHRLIKGILIHPQTAKAKTSCMLLQIPLKAYRKFSRKLVTSGQRHGIIRLYNMILRSYLRKRKAR